MQCSLVCPNTDGDPQHILLPAHPQPWPIALPFPDSPPGHTSDPASVLKGKPVQVHTTPIYTLIHHIVNTMLLTPCLPSPQKDIESEPSKTSDQKAKHGSGEGHMQAYRE